MSNKMDDSSDCVTETRYQHLSYQIFGDPTQGFNCCKGPFIDLKRKSTDHVLPQLSKRICRKKKNLRSVINTSMDSKRCLICYSDISRMDLLVDETKKERSEDLIEFLNIITIPSSITILNGNLNSTVLEQLVKQLVNMYPCLCVSCNAACQKLLQVQRTMRKLQLEVKEFQVKFLNAVKLSKAIAEKNNKLIRKNNQDEVMDEEEEDCPVISEHLATNSAFDTKSVVDQIRTCLVGGKGMWHSMKDKWMNYVHLDNEFTRKPKHLPKLQKKTKTRERKKRLPETSKKGSQVSIMDSLVKTIKVENDKLSPTEVENGSLELGPQQGGIENSYTTDETTRNDSYFDDDDDDTLDASLLSENGDPEKLECDSVGHGQLHEEKQIVESNASSTDQKPASDELDPNEENRTTTMDSLVKRKKPYYGPVGVAHPFSFVHKPTDKPLSKGAIRYRKHRAQHPNISAKEFVLLRKNLKLPMGRTRRPIEELKSTPQKPLTPYMKWRQSHHGMTMSIPAYKKMRRELALQRQKIVDEGGPFMSKLNGSLIPVRWVEKNGKLTFLGVEVKKHEDGTFSCSLCPDWNFAPCKNKNSLKYHIKKYHIEVDKKFACEQCDAKFHVQCELKLHQKEKHEGGHICELCGSVLSDRSALYQHVRIKHKGIKPHICEHCGKGFGTRKDMTIHVRRHTGERPFVCHVCADTFIEKQSMKKHIRTKHPGEPTDEIKIKPQKFIVSKSTTVKTSSEEPSQKSSLNSCS